MVPAWAGKAGVSASPGLPEASISRARFWGAPGPKKRDGM